MNACVSAAVPEATPHVDPIDQFLAEVRAEIARARSLYPGARLSTIALGEEVGEVCKAIMDEPASHVRIEAVQVCATAARLALEGDRSVDEYRRSRGLDPLPAGRAA